MSAAELLAEVRQSGGDLELSDDGRRFRVVRYLENLPSQLVSALRRERLWILMLLVHEAGGDAHDPRLAFVASAERGLTLGAIRTRMQVAFGVNGELAEALIELAHEACYLRKGTDGLYWSHGQTGFQLLRNRSEALATA